MLKIYHKIRPCWILTSVRSGSWLLCDLLNKTNLFDDYFEEYMHWSHPKRNCYPLFCKAIRRHFLSCHDDKEVIEKKIPEIKYIWLHRKDNYERAISLYFSIISNIWTTNSKNKKNEFLLNKNKNKIKFNEKLALACYSEAASEYHNNWKSFLSKRKYLYVDYDLFINDIENQFNSILNYLELKSKFKIKIDSIPMKRQETDEFVFKLKEIVNKNKNKIPIVNKKNNVNVYKELIRSNFF